MHKRRRRDPWLKLFLCNFFLLLKSTWPITFLNVNQTMQEFFRKFRHKNIIERSSYFSIGKKNKISLDLFMDFLSKGWVISIGIKFGPILNQMYKIMALNFLNIWNLLPFNIFGYRSKSEKSKKVISYICLGMEPTWK